MAKTETVTMVRKDGTKLKVSKENAEIFKKCGYEVENGKGKKSDKKDKSTQTPDGGTSQTTDK